MGLVNTLAFLAVSLMAAKTSQFIRATFNAQYYKVKVVNDRLFERYF